MYCLVKSVSGVGSCLDSADLRRNTKQLCQTFNFNNSLDYG